MIAKKKKKIGARKAITGVIYSLISISAWRSVRHCVIDWPSWSMADSSVWAAYSISKTGIAS